MAGLASDAVGGAGTRDHALTWRPMSNLYDDLAQPRPAGLDTPRRALAIGAHPDDIEFGAGATLARWADDGCEITMIVVTDGSKGSWDPDDDTAELIAIRQQEAQAAAGVLGASRIEFLGRVDGELEATRELREAVCGWIRLLQPDVVATHDPWQRYQLHPDHRATGWIVTDAVVAARDPHFFAHQLTGDVVPHRPTALLLWSADEPNHWEDSSTTLDRKVTALLCHASQGRTTMANAHEGGPARDAFAARIAEWAARSGAAAGVRSAEAFRRLTP